MDWWEGVAGAGVTRGRSCGERGGGVRDEGMILSRANRFGDPAIVAAPENRRPGHRRGVSHEAQAAKSRTEPSMSRFSRFTAQPKIKVVKTGLNGADYVDYKD